MPYNFAHAFNPPAIPQFEGPIIGFPPTSPLTLDLRATWIQAFADCVSIHDSRISRQWAIHWLDTNNAMPRTAAEILESFDSGDCRTLAATCAAQWAEMHAKE